MMHTGRWRHLASIIELPMCGDDAACCQITLTACLIILSIAIDCRIVILFVIRLAKSRPDLQGH